MRQTVGIEEQAVVAEGPSPDAATPARRPLIAVEPGSLSPWSWTELFGNDRPVELEIGVGKGTFLLNRARAAPSHNFFGIEWANEFYRYALDRMARWNVINVRILRTDAAHFIRHVCPPASLRALHVYHPDPWPKRRHHKRRLFQPAFVDAAVRCLERGGRWFVQTDHAEYFAMIRPLLLGHPELTPADFIAPIEAEDDDPPRLGTNFETKYLREGRVIHRLAVQRV